MMSSDSRLRSAVTIFFALLDTRSHSADEPAWAVVLSTKMMIPHTHNASFSEVEAHEKAQFFTVVLDPGKFSAFSEIGPVVDSEVGLAIYSCVIPIRIARYRSSEYCRQSCGSLPRAPRCQALWIRAISTPRRP